uniref:CBP3 n=1 Tax=Phytophthora capsici TaxID=4784 RepID=A0A8E5JS15_PHYCP|nr:CBP3 [Phytophthora capsici]
MKFTACIATVIATFSVANAVQEASVHLRVHSKGGCTITNESQCNGQNWTGSTCCADSNYECRWSDDGQNVQRCQKKWYGGGGNTGGNNNGGCTITNESQCDGQNWSGSTCCADSSYECRWSDDGQNVKRCQKKKW